MDFPDWNALFSRLGLAAAAHRPAISLRGFIDLESDVVGVYAVGHHPTAAFLAAARLFEPLLAARPEKLRHSWAEINGTEFEEVYPWKDGALPITLIELYDVDLA